MKTYDVVHYTKNNERIVYLEELEDYATAKQHADVIANCSGMKVIVEETPVMVKPKKSIINEFGEIMDLAYVLRNTVGK
jgi:hypothetical protein